MSCCTMPMHGGEEGGGGADDGDDAEREGAAVEEGVAARDHVDAGGDHGGGVDERGDRGGAFHGVGEPDVERDLRGLAGGAEDEQQRDGGEEAAVPRRDARDGGEDVGEVEACRSGAMSRNMASRKPKSPMRLTMKAFLPALAAESFLK